MSKILGAVVITYFRDTTATLGIPIAVLVYRDLNDVEIHVRKDWQPVLAYEEGADLEFLQSVVRDGLDRFEHDKTWLTSLAGAENLIRSTKLDGADPLFAHKLADAMRCL